MRTSMLIVARRKSCLNTYRHARRAGELSWSRTAKTILQDGMESSSNETFKDMQY